jgi:hypothetical protein
MIEKARKKDAAPKGCPCPATRGEPQLPCSCLRAASVKVVPAALRSCQFLFTIPFCSVDFLQLGALRPPRVLISDSGTDIFLLWNAQDMRARRHLQAGEGDRGMRRYTFPHLPTASGIANPHKNHGREMGFFICRRAHRTGTRLS